MHLTMLILRFIHIVGGAIWVGTTVFLALFIEPAARTLGVAGGQIMAELGRRKFSPRIAAVGGLTVLSGIILFGIDSDWFRSPWMHTPQAIGLSIGAASAIIGMIFGIGVSRPCVEKLGKLMPKAAQMGPGPERDAIMVEANALSEKLRFSGRMVAICLTIAVAFMGIARYL